MFMTEQLMELLGHRYACLVTHMATWGGVINGSSIVVDTLEARGGAHSSARCMDGPTNQRVPSLPEHGIHAWLCMLIVIATQVPC
jgi:hypothetical protein